VEKIKTRLRVDGPVASVKGKSGDGLAPMDQRNGEEQASQGSMNQKPRDDMKWIISFMRCWCMCCTGIDGVGDGDEDGDRNGKRKAKV